MYYNTLNIIISYEIILNHIFFIFYLFFTIILKLMSLNTTFPNILVEYFHIVPLNF